MVSKRLLIEIAAIWIRIHCLSSFDAKFLVHISDDLTEIRDLTSFAYFGWFTFLNPLGKWVMSSKYTTWNRGFKRFKTILGFSWKFQNPVKHVSWIFFQNN